MTDTKSPSKVQIQRWMKANLGDHMDACNEVNCTGLAEAAAYHFDAIEDDGQIAEVYFEAAGELAVI
jgi:hypothetical protein